MLEYEKIIKENEEHNSGLVKKSSYDSNTSNYILLRKTKEYEALMSSYLAEIDELRHQKQLLENEKMDDEVLLEELVKQLEIEKADKANMENVIKSLNDTVMHYKREVAIKKEQVNNLNVIIKKKESGSLLQVDSKSQIEQSDMSKVDSLHKEILAYKNELKNMIEVNSTLRDALKGNQGPSSISQHLSDGAIERLENEVKSYKWNIVPDLKQQIETLNIMLEERDEQLDNLKLSYSILENKYKMEKYKNDYGQHNRRSRIEELEDNLRVVRRET